MNFKFSSLLSFLKNPTTLMFMFLTVLLGTLLFFMNNNHLQKTNISKKQLKTFNTNKYKSSKLSNTNKTANKIKNPYLKYAFDNYIPLGITGKTANLNNFVDLILISKNYDYLLNSNPNNLKNIKLNDGNVSTPGSTGISTGGAIPIPFPYSTFYNTLTSFIPVSVAVSETAASTKVSSLTPPRPKPPVPIPVPEASSMLLSLIAISGALGFKAKHLSFAVLSSK